MRLVSRVLSAGAAVATALACGCSGSGGSESPDPGTAAFAEEVQGTWTRCWSLGPGGTDRREVITLVGTAYSKTVFIFPTHDLTCGGDGALLSVVIGSFAASEAVPATLGSGWVRAYAFDHAGATATVYDIAYVDATQTPMRLYLGDKTGSNGGSTPETRPTALDPSFFAQYAEPRAFAAALEGSWRRCWFDGTKDVSSSYSFYGGIANHASFSHATTDGTCGGAGTTIDAWFNVFAIGPGVGAALGSGGPTVCLDDAASYSKT